MTIDAHEILSDWLFQGSDPPRGRTLANHGIDTLVLCAIERQHPSEAFPGVRVIRAPMDDGAVVPEEIATRAASIVTMEIRSGHRVLVCCNQGINRSGLVCALVVWRLLGLSGRNSVRHVQARRPGALGNPVFANWLKRLSPFDWETTGAARS